MRRMGRYDHKLGKRRDEADMRPFMVTSIYVKVEGPAVAWLKTWRLEVSADQGRLTQSSHVLTASKGRESSLKYIASRVDVSIPT